MAQYDGSIRINTEILVKSAEKQLRALENNMEKTAEKAASLRDKMEALRTTQIPTQEYKDISVQIEKAEQGLGKLVEKQAQMERDGKNSGASWENLNQKIQATKDYIDSAKEDLKSLVDSGKAFTLGSSTQEYARIGQQLKYTEASLETMNQQHEITEARLEAALQKREAEKAKLRETISEEMRLAEIKRDATVADQELIDLLERRKEVLQEIADMQKVGVGEGYQEYYDAQGELSEIDERINAIREARAESENTQSAWESLKEVTKETLVTMAKGLRDIPIAIVKAGIRSITSAVRELGNVVQKSAIAPFKLLGATAKKIFSSIGKSSKASNNMLNKGFKNILKYGLGIRSVYMLINKFRTAVKEGFNNLAQVSEPVNESLSSLKSSLTQLKNSLATAFAPILTAIAPALTTLINMISQAATYVGMFIATLTGASSFTKAIAVQEDYAASLNKTGSAAKKAAGALAKFDDLDVLAQPSSGGGGAGAAETPVTDMFEEVEIPDKFKDMTQWIKDMWAESDFTELGSFLGEKLKEGLDNIPWDSIQERARKLGASLATLINGAVETDGLGYMLGNTLAQGINTAFNFLNSFVKEIHADSIGKFLAEAVNGITESIEWDVIYDTFTTGAHKLAELINNFLSPENLNYESISSTISNFVNTIVDSLYILITETKWAEIGKSFGKAISDAWIGINWAKAGETLGEYFKAFFDFVGKAIENVEWQKVGKDVSDFIKGIKWADVAKSLFEAIGAAFGGLAGFLVGLIGEAWKSVVEWWRSTANEDGKHTIEGFLNGIGEALINIGDWIMENIFFPFIDGFKAAFGIHSPSTVMAEMGTYLMEGLLDGITGLMGDVEEKWENMKTTALETWETTKTKLSEKWEEIEKNSSKTFGDMKESVSKIFDGMWGNIKKVINSILGGVEKMANGVVDAINTMIRALNSLSFTIPGWIPGLGGKSFSLNLNELSNVSIPRLATGAVLRGGNPFMAVLNDQPAGHTNIEAPLATIEQALDNVMDRRGGYGGERVPVTINLNYDGETFARLSIPDILSELARQGYDISILGAN